MRIAVLTTDNRDHHRRYDLSDPYFGPAIEALLQGLMQKPDLEIHIVSCTQKPMRASEKLAKNTWFHLLHVPKIGWLRTGYQGCIRATRSKLREIKPDIVHGQGTERDCSLGAVFSCFPNVITIHGNVRAIARATKAPIGTYWWWTARLEGFTLPRTGGVICNSRHTELQVKPHARRTWLAPNALRREFLETPLPVQTASPKPILLNIGTITPLKQQLVLLDLAEELHREGHSFEIHFVGNADPNDKYTAEFFQRVQIAERNNYARYLGTKPISELIKLMDESAAIIHVPFEEAFGLVAAEGLSRNLKFFGTDVGGLRDIADGVEGAELFPVENPGRLRAAISNWLRTGSPQPDTAAGEMNKRYHPDVIARRHVEIYRNVSGA